MMSWIRLAVASAFLCAASSGCAPVDESPSAADADDEYVTSTSVEIDASGEARVTSVEVYTVREMEDQLAAREALSAPSVENGEEHVGTSAEPLSTGNCTNWSVWGYDGPNRTGNRLCINGPGAGGDQGGYFGNVCKKVWVLGGHLACRETWGRTMVSFISGIDTGRYTSYWDGVSCHAIPTGTVGFGQEITVNNVPCATDTIAF